MTLRLGWTVPTGLSPVELREFAMTAEHLGYDHLSVPEHLVSSTPAYESLTLVAFLAAVTTRIELATAMTILPHRPVVLAAKQAAQLAHLSGDRLRLGVATGADPAESAALGAVPGTRAALFEEQVRALRLLWTRPAADFAGEHVAFTGVTVTPRPRRIPLWMGGGTLRTGGRPGALRRIATLADGFTMSGLLANRVNRGAALIAELRTAVTEAGRDWAAFGTEARLRPAPGRPDTWRSLAQAWRSAGATHLTVTTDDLSLLAPLHAALTG
ncbi:MULTISPECIES: TIGR03619 family F420-dependent LLM class oxidoreductase [Streptomyces]|uniref:TIGR03619 family F420-dependent LLM class oxidoreductase n=1 Tax=Streptomyces TaxID=1883 RepID=UPI00196695FB|nr:MULTISPECIES: TIGR03619 family F420-dependent LLM class oxidoreductase [Streptomyces]QRX89662.1 TIGR03619 family F420-dependent LLM class oxidoreductase [Streptomyces noursei]UJB39679.1 TIGR03619 family F420-dependent LLM class oxidoreductase [Streptomyces sp. A1-5]